jgi:hypothetical protein
MFLGSILIFITYEILFTFELYKTIDTEILLTTRWIFTIVFIIWLTYSTTTKYWMAIGLAANVVLNFVLFGHIIANLEYGALWVLPPPIVLYAFTL